MKASLNRFPYLFFLLLMCIPSFAQNSPNKLWHGIEREVHYQPDGEDFLLVNGKRRFNRALYGGNTAFRAEAGDLPEFALYLPGMGGNLKFGLIVNDSSKWLIDAQHIQTRYRPGSMIYTIQDPLLQNGSITITAIALYDREGLIIKVESRSLPSNVKLFAAYGGATGIRFSREGDIGADPESSFYLKPEYCNNNIYNINKNAFTLFYGSRTLTEEERYEIQYKPKTDSAKLAVTLKSLSGIFPPASLLKISDAKKQSNPLQFYQSHDSTTAAITTQINFSETPLYFFIQNGTADQSVSYTDLPIFFTNAEGKRKELAGRIKITTPDPYINTLGGALAVAADAVWEDPSFMHGAIAWRMRLNGWRGAYTADALGWHDRAKMHFSSYALSQVTEPLSAPVVMDTALNLARHAEKMGTSVFSSGYISRNPGGDKRPHHYDMNLVFIDQLLNHFLWTGDTAYVKEMWPLLKRHLDWENRNFDVDKDYLYDAYAAIWASDALQYSGGGVTHSSAYNYKAFKMAGELAALVGENGAPYKKQAANILKAINQKLWMPAKGVYGEYKDLLGKKLLHPSPALWTIYHAIDSYVPDPFQAYQSLKYIDQNIPHIPIRAKGFKDTTLFTLSTSNWQPYTWSLNNVVLGEVMHTALAYWQGGRSEEAYKIWKGSLIESMYLGASPGNIQQLSFYDAIRGELYRDFADDIGMTARALVEGLFGIFPDALHDTLQVTPGFPSEWKHAGIKTPDFDFSFRNDGATDRYEFISHLPQKLNAVFQLKAKSDAVVTVLVNGNQTKWSVDDSAIENPLLIIKLPESHQFIIEIKWGGSAFKNLTLKREYVKGEIIKLQGKNHTFVKIFDPQKALTGTKKTAKEMTAVVGESGNNKTFFVQVKQGSFTYWMPVNFKAVKPVEIFAVKNAAEQNILVKNNTPETVTGKFFLNGVEVTTLSLSPNSSSAYSFNSEKLIAGTNSLRFEGSGKVSTETFIDWVISNTAALKYEKVDLTAYFNDEVSNIFKNKYLSPRPKGPTLQLPTQGIGNWAYPLIMPNISDSGLRVKAAGKNEITIAQGIPFATPAAAGKNIIYTSQWDNYPDSIKIPLKGKASHAYFLMAGTTNPMQTRLVNAEIIIHYKDGTSEKLELKNPENWWPIEQDYYVDDFAFTTDAPKPVRVYLKTGEDTREFKNFINLRGFSTKGIEGGAATVLNLPLNKSKELKDIVVNAIANDVVIGLMSVTLLRP